MCDYVHGPAFVRPARADPPALFQRHSGCSAAVDARREKAIGRKVVIEFSASTYLKKEIDAGEPFDVVILTPGIIDDLANSGTLAPSSKRDIASSDLAVGIRAGSAKADVSTPDGMKKRLLAAKTLTWTDGGASAPAVLAMF